MCKYTLLIIVSLYILSLLPYLLNCLYVLFVTICTVVYLSLQAFVHYIFIPTLKQVAKPSDKLHILIGYLWMKETK